MKKKIELLFQISVYQISLCAIAMTTRTITPVLVLAQYCKVYLKTLLGSAGKWRHLAKKMRLLAQKKSASFYLKCIISAALSPILNS